MFVNNLKIVFRNFRNNKLFTLINIAGLAIGICTSLVIYLIVQHEFNYDRFHKDGDRIYRVVSEIKYPDLTIHNSGVPVPTEKAMRDEVSGIEAQTHFFTSNPLKVSIPLAENQSPTIFKNQPNIIYADKYYFDLFNYVWLAGSSISALNDPFQVVLTENRAKIYFANLAPKDIIGQKIIYDDSLTMVISGIVKDSENPTDFNFQEFISRTTVEKTHMKKNFNWEEWGSISSNSQLFVKLVSGVNKNRIEEQLISLRKKYLKIFNQTGPDQEKDDTKHFLQPLANIHFAGDYNNFDGGKQANKSTLMGLLAVALFLLLLGCINFINLSTAMASQRAKEIGIRKTMGSGKSQLIVQFLSETFLLTLLSVVVSIALTPALITTFRDFIPAGITFQSINQFHVWIFLILLSILISLLSGFYPALVLSKFKPVTVLKNQAFDRSSTSRKAWLRKGLSISQFVITQVLLISILIVSKQLKFSIHKDLGFKKDAIVFFNTEWDIFSDKPDNRRFILLDKLKEIKELENISLGSRPPSAPGYNTSTMKYSDGDKIVETMVETKTADANYFTVYKMNLVAGANLRNSDTIREFVINETYAKLLGFKDPNDAVGKFIERDKRIPIAGVIKDFHAQSTHSPIKPLAFSASNRNNYTVHLALQPRGNDQNTWSRALTNVEKVYKTIYPESDFKYTFFDESIASFYKAEQDTIRLLKWAVGLCIFISCLGLLGMIIHVVSQRTKEIGVRKVLGASIGQVVTLLSKDFVQIVILALIIASPIAWWLMNKWLADFSYRVDIGWFIFLITGFSTICIALLTISFQTIKAAMANPTKSLRTE